MPIGSPLEKRTADFLIVFLIFDFTKCEQARRFMQPQD
jgi:hypothetical protein